MNINNLLNCLGNPTCLLTQLTGAVVIAVILFLTASGLSFIFGVLGIGNFAHGSLYMIGAYLTYTIMSSFGNFWLALILAPIGVGVLGLVVERLLIRRIYGSAHVYQFLLTFGLLLAFDDVVRFIWGFNFKSIPTPKLFQQAPLLRPCSPTPPYFAKVDGIRAYTSNAKLA